MHREPEDEKKDPRVLRTRQLIQEAFKTLIVQKDIKDITVGDITERATVNRATFYAHFADKYELMDDTFAQQFRESIMQKLECHAVFNRASVAGIIVTLCEFHRDFSTQCQKSYESASAYFESKVKALLQEVLFHLMRKESGDASQASFGGEEAELVSTMLAWSIYGITHAWNREGRKQSPEQLADQALTSLAKGMRQLDGLQMGVG